MSMISYLDLNLDCAAEVQRTAFITNIVVISNQLLELLANASPLGHETDECLLLVVSEATDLQFRIGEDWLIVRRHTYDYFGFSHFNTIMIKRTNQSMYVTSDAPYSVVFSPTRLGFAAPCQYPVCSSCSTTCMTARYLDESTQPTFTIVNA